MRAQPLHRRMIRLGLAWFAVGSVAAQTSVLELAPPDVYRQYVDAYSRGRIEEALTYFADDARVVAGPACTLSAPCVGKAAIRERYLAVMMRQRLPAPISDQRYDGVRFRTRGEKVQLMAPGGAVVPLMGGHTFEFARGRIISLAFALDSSDPATGAFLAQIAAAGWMARLDPR